MLSAYSAGMNYFSESHNISTTNMHIAKREESGNIRIWNIYCLPDSHRQHNNTKAVTRLELFEIPQVR